MVNFIEVFLTVGLCNKLLRSKHFHIFESYSNIFKRPYAFFLCIWDLKLNYTIRQSTSENKLTLTWVITYYEFSICTIGSSWGHDMKNNFGTQKLFVSVYTIFLTGVCRYNWDKSTYKTLMIWKYISWLVYNGADAQSERIFSILMSVKPFPYYFVLEQFVNCLSGSSYTTQLNYTGP